MTELAARHPGVVSVVDFGAKMSPDGKLAMSIDGVRVRTDGVHLTPDAGRWFAPWFLPQVVAIADAPR